MGILDQPKFEKVIERLFEEGRCEHASGDDVDRKTECNMCFTHVQKKVDKLEALADKYNIVQGSTWGEDAIPEVRKVTAMWMFCANNYLAPVYSDCFDQEAALRTATDEGKEGLISYVNCAQNMTKAWVAERRPEVMDYMTDYWRGGPVYPEDMED